MTAQPSRLNTISSRVRGWSDFMGGVMACAAAAQSGRHPPRTALKAIGIDADAYYSIRRR